MKNTKRIATSNEAKGLVNKKKRKTLACDIFGTSNTNSVISDIKLNGSDPTTMKSFLSTDLCKSERDTSVEINSYLNVLDSHNICNPKAKTDTFDADSSLISEKKNETSTEIKYSDTFFESRTDQKFNNSANDFKTTSKLNKPINNTSRHIEASTKNCRSAVSNANTNLNNTTKIQSVAINAKKIISEITQTTAKVSIGNTTISVPLLKPVCSKKIMQDSVDNKNETKNKSHQSYSQKKQPSEVNTTTFNFKCAQHLDAAAAIASLSPLQIKPPKNSNVIQATVLSKKIKLQNYADVTAQTANNISSIREKTNFSQRPGYPKEVSVLCHGTLHNKYSEEEPKLSTINVEPFLVQKPASIKYTNAEYHTNIDNESESNLRLQDSTALSANLITCKDRLLAVTPVAAKQNISINPAPENCNSVVSTKKTYPKASLPFCKFESSNTPLQSIKTKKDIIQQQIALPPGVTIANATSVSSKSNLSLTVRNVSSSIAVNCALGKNGPAVGILNVPQTISLTPSKNCTSETTTSGAQNVESKSILDPLTKRNSFSKIITLKNNENHYSLQDANKGSLTTSNDCSKRVDVQSHEFNREAPTKALQQSLASVKNEEKCADHENSIHNSAVKPNFPPKNYRKTQYNGSIGVEKTKISEKYMLSKFDSLGTQTGKYNLQEIYTTELVTSKSEESRNILLKQLLKSTSAITGQGISSPISTAASSICNQALSNRKIINVRAPSLGVVSSLEAQLARPVMPPVPTTTGIISTDNETRKEGFEEANKIKQSIQIISKETSFVSNPAFSSINLNSNNLEVPALNVSSSANRFNLNASIPNLDVHSPYSDDSLNSAESFVSSNSCVNKSPDSRRCHRNGKNITSDKRTFSSSANTGNEQQRSHVAPSDNLSSDKNAHIGDNSNLFVAENKNTNTSSSTELSDRSENYREKNKPQTTSPSDIIYTSHVSQTLHNCVTSTKIWYNNDKIINSLKLSNNSSKPQNIKENSVEAKQTNKQIRKTKRKRQIHNHIINSNIRTNSSESGRKRLRKSLKCDEDYDIFMDHLVNQMRKLSALEILEPIVCHHKGICAMYGSTDLSKFINKEYQSHSSNRFFHDRNPQRTNKSNFYEEQPFGIQKKLSESNSVMQNSFYDEEFMPYVAEMEQNKFFKLFNRTKCHSVNNSENVFTKSNVNGKSYYPWNAFSQASFPGLVERNYDNEYLGRQSPVVPYIKPLALRLGSVVSLPSSVNCSDLYREKGLVSKSDEDRSYVTVILTLSSTDVGFVLKDLANLLNISPVSSYKLLDLKNTKSLYSQKEYCKSKGQQMPFRKADIQGILNGSKKICRNCGFPIANAPLGVCLRDIQHLTKNNLEMISEYIYFCNKECCLSFKNQLISKSPKEHYFDNLIKKSGYRKQTLGTIHELSRVKRCRFKHFKYSNIQHRVRTKNIIEKEVEGMLFGLDVTVRQNYSSVLECERKEKIVKDNRRCYLCNESGDDSSDKASRLLNFDVNKWVHLNCALWSSGVYETVNGGLRNVEVAIQTGSNQVCSSCQQLGATIKCSKSRCETIYHFPCAKEEQGTFYKENIFHCRTHHVKTIKNNELCSLNAQRRVFVDQDENRLVAEFMQRQDLDNLLRVGSIIYLSAGQLILHHLDVFHNSNCIYPVGYKIIRFYWSMKRPKKRCRYLCTIMEVDKRPQFIMKVLDKNESEYTLKESTPNLVWHSILELITASIKHQRQVQIFPKFISGDDFFGLTEPLIVRILQSLPDVETLHHNYFKSCRNPLMELALPLHTSGAARTEPQQKHVLGLKKSHTQRTATTANQRLTNTMVVGEVACPYSKQFVHSKSSQYKKMNQEWRNNVYLARSKIQGLGLYAARDLEKHTMVIEYIGEVIRTEVSEIREKLYAARNRGIYMFRLDEDRIVDATLSGGLARYINHSCNPNCVTEIVDVERELRIIIFAKRRINRGEELSYDYKFDFEDDANKLMCMCGALNCRKWMN